MQLSILVDPEGTVTFPSLGSEFVSVAQALDRAFVPLVPVGTTSAARYLDTKRIPTRLPRAVSRCSDEELWAAHRETREAEPSDAECATSRLDVKIELATRLLRACRLCPWNCGVDRLAGQLGFCGLGRAAFYSQEFLHFGEEPAIRPSHTIFLTGCSLRCVYCLTGETVVRPRQGTPLEPADMAARIDRRAREGGRSISFVGGNPDQNLLPILETLRACWTDRPIVWNSNLYAAPTVMDLLEGVVDVHVADLKYGSDACARRASGVPAYWDTVTPNLGRAAADAHLIVRHLLLPGHGECCTGPVLRWMAAHLPGIAVNLMAQYRPDHLVKPGGRSPLGRRVTVAEAEAARRLAAALGVPLVDQTAFVEGAPVPR
jgi:putative pyruvate formate lyase activating enzyme